MNAIKLNILVISFLILSGCFFFGEKEEDVKGIEEGIVEKELTQGNKSYHISGFVRDDRGNFLNNVTINLSSGETTQTGLYGYYSINTSLKNRGLINYEKEGFAPLHKTFNFGKKNITKNIQLMEIDEFVDVPLDSSGVVNSSGASLSYSEDSFVIKGTDKKVTFGDNF